MKDHMTETIAIVDADRAKVDAYVMGHERFRDAEIGDPADFDLAPFKSSAAFANNTDPRLRSMAGYADAGRGTYTSDRKVAVVKAHTDGDRPREAELIESADWLHGKLIRAFDMGAYDAVEDTYDPDAAVSI